MASFSQAHPNIDVQTVASEELANFQTDRVDLAIRQGHPPFGNGLHAELLAPLDLRAVCSSGFAKMAAPIMQIGDFTAQQLIQDSHNLWDSLFEEVGLNARNRVVQFNQTTLAMDAAANGQGIALAPRILLQAEFEQGRLVELWRDIRKNQDGYYIVYPRSRDSDSTRDAFIAWAISEVESIKTDRYVDAYNRIKLVFTLKFAKYKSVRSIVSTNYFRYGLFQHNKSIAVVY